MDPVNVIRAPSLKRGKPDERLSDRVSIEFSFRLIIIVIRTRVCDCLTDMSNIREASYVTPKGGGRRNL